MNIYEYIVWYSNTLFIDVFLLTHKLLCQMHAKYCKVQFIIIECIDLHVA